jgi:hypothetical protein
MVLIRYRDWPIAFAEPGAMIAHPALVALEELQQSTPWCASPAPSACTH